MRMIFNIVLLTLSVSVALGCHPRHHGNTDARDGNNADALSRRQKRQVQDYTLFVPFLEDYFTMCLRPYRGQRNLDIRTVVQYSIDQSSWFQRSDQQFCRSDTVPCWQNILFRYLSFDSELTNPILFCIQQYGLLRSGQQTAYLNGVFSGRARRKRRHDVPSVPVNEGNFAAQLRQALPFYQGDVRSLIEFFKGDAFCSPGICTCQGIILPPGEFCGQNWYTRIAAMTRVDSPIREPLVRATNMAVAAAVQQQRRDEQRRQNQRQSQSQQQLMQMVQVLVISQALMPTITPPITTTTTNATTTMMVW